MMNFKKNQNNAVCSMDCKDCPNGASQPNPMDDPKFEKSIAMLHNWVMLEAIREDHPKERIVMVILPGTGGELLTEAGSRDIFEDVYDEMEADLVAGGELLLHYDKSDVIETDRTRYLLGAAEVSEIDQNGNECSQPCRDEIWENRELVKELTSRLNGAHLPEEDVPRCRDCGRVLVPWVRDDTFLEGRAWKAQLDRYHAFLRHWLLEQTGKNILLLELGVGEMTPSIIKLPFWELTARNQNVFYACLNKEASHTPEHLRGRSLYLQGDLAEILSAIRQKRPNANAKSEGVNNHG